MIFPTPAEVSKKIKHSSNRSNFIRNYPLTESEIKKIVPTLKKQKRMSVIDTSDSFVRFLNQLDAIFGTFKTVLKDKIVFKGRLDFKEKSVNVLTGEPEAIFILSDPRTLYRDVNTSPVLIKVPYNSNLLSGGYAEVEAKTTNTGIEATKITPKNIELQMPTLFIDYAKFTDAFNLYGFDFSDTAQIVRRNMELNNLDLVLMNKIAGENFKQEVKGAVNCNIVKTTRDQGSYQLEVLDEFLNKATFNQKTETVFTDNLIRGGTVEQFNNIVNKNNRQMDATIYPNYYGTNVGFSMNKISHAEADKFVQQLPNTCIDYLNPIGNLDTGSHHAVSKLLDLDKSHIFSSKALFLETQLLGITAPVSDLLKVDAKTLRMAAMLKKFEVIDNLGTDEILPQIKINSSNVNRADKFLKNNKEFVEEFITNRG